ncbi:MAG: manganese efflux pump MntP family protein [bacterium]|nr:manganese efflux pump MntP family protein [bacterium]
MSYLSVFIIGIGLSMDAFAVSICKGLSMKKLAIKQAIIVGLYFGGFQALMPLIGYFLGTSFESKIQSVSSYVAFILLALIGANMIKEAFSKEELDEDASLNFKTMVLLAIATSIDALAVGVSLAFFEVNIYPSILIIGVTTFVISIAGVKIGNVFGAKYKSKAEIIGGLILIGMGLKILLEHLNLLPF